MIQGQKSSEKKLVKFSPVTPPHDRISRYRNATQEKPIAAHTVGQILEEIKDTTHQAAVQRCRERLAQGSIKEYRDLKKKLPAVTFGGVFKPTRGNQNIATPTGIIVADLDHLEPGTLESIERMLREDPYVRFLFRSPSGEGLKCGLHTDGIRDNEDHKRFYLAVERYFSEIYGIKIDASCKDISRLTFLSHDPQAHDNPGAAVFPVTEEKTAPGPQLSSNGGNPHGFHGKTLYAWRVLQGCCDQIRKAPPGEKHYTRRSAARTAGGYVHHGIPDDVALVELIEAARSNTDDPRTAEKTIRTFFEHGKASPISIEDPKPTNPKKQPEEPPPPQDEIPAAEILQAANDEQDGDARLFIRLSKDKLTYDHAAGRWYAWQGQHWTEDETEQVLASVGRVVDLYAAEASRCGWQATKAIRAGNLEAAGDLEVKRKALHRAIKALQKVQWKKAVLELSAAGAGSLGISGRRDFWDSQPHLLGCKNGVIDLEGMGFRPGQPGDFIKTAAPTDWRGLNEPAPTFEQFMRDIFDGDEDLITYVQRLLGSALIGRADEHLLPIFWGLGRNGKGTLLETLAHVLGAAAGPIPSEMLLQQKHVASGAAPSPDVMSLRGRRLAWASETNEARKLNVGKVKWLVGGDTLAGRELYGQMVNFRPTHTMILLTNHKPRIDAEDYAMWQRVHLVPFTLSFVDNPKAAFERKKDGSLPARLRAEASGILAWLVRGCLDYQANGLIPPQTVIAATEEYRESEDILGAFLAERCVRGPSVQVRGGAFYSEYKRWCEEMGHYPISNRKFGETMKKRFDYYDDNRGVIYVGVGLSA